MNEQEFRNAIVTEAKSWVGTPYRNSGSTKKIGVNCAMFLYQVALNAKVLPENAPKPAHYSPQFSVNQKQERLLAVIDSYGAKVITEEQAKPGDIVVYKNGLSHGHAAIIISWPEAIIHVMGVVGCQEAHGLGGILLGMDRVFRTLWQG